MFEQYFDRVYENYDRYAIIPLALVLLSVGILGASYMATAEFPYVQAGNGSVSFTPGSVFEKGVEFSSGTEIQARLSSTPDVLEVERAFASAGYPDAQATIGEPDADRPLILVKLKESTKNKTEVAEILSGAGYTLPGGPDSIQLATYSPAVSQSFFTQAVVAVVLAFTTMSIVIFAAFKDITPSLAVIFAASGDIIFSLAMMSLLGIPLTLGTIAALLMLIGYSVDTDIVLSSRVLKKTHGSLKSRIFSSLKTGVTMSSGGIVAFTILYIVAMGLVGAPSILTEVASVMVIGLLADMPLTWFGNAYILKRYAEEDWKPVESMMDSGWLPWS
ncbi:MAG: hypothetical protein ABEJ64_02750 [Candidatus Nanohaloarchaea archaeon]